MSTAEVPPELGLESPSFVEQNQNFQLVERLCEQFREETNIFLIGYALSDGKFEQTAQALAQDGTEVADFIDGDSFGIRIHLDEGTPQEVCLGIYPAETDELDWLGAGYIDAQGNRQIFELHIGEVVAPPPQVAAAIREVNEIFGFR